MTTTRRYLEMWPLVLNLAKGTGRRATWREALAYAREKRAGIRHAAAILAAYRARKAKQR